MCNSGITCEVKPIENIISLRYSVLFDGLYTVKMESNAFDFFFSCWTFRTLLKENIWPNVRYLWCTIEIMKKLFWLLLKALVWS